MRRSERDRTSAAERSFELIMHTPGSHYRSVIRFRGFATSNTQPCLFWPRFFCLRGVAEVTSSSHAKARWPCDIFSQSGPTRRGHHAKTGGGARPGASRQKNNLLKLFGGPPSSLATDGAYMPRNPFAGLNSAFSYRPSSQTSPAGRWCSATAHMPGRWPY